MGAWSKGATEQKDTSCRAKEELLWTRPEQQCQVKSLAGGSMPGRVQLPRARGLLLREVMPRVFSVGGVGNPLCLPRWVTHSKEAEDTSTLP